MNRAEQYIAKIKEVAEAGEKGALTWLPALRAIIALCKEYNDYKEPSKNKKDE